jgi:Leucine-rich repeat (LRR) protein
VILLAQCRQAMLCIEGVRYRFKDSFVSTQQKFIGYIAQQVQEFVLEAVKCINGKRNVASILRDYLTLNLAGILHVDYEALIPYISESVRQNYHDINRLEADMNQLSLLIDQLYEQFQRFETQRVHSTPVMSDVIEYPKKANKARGWVIGVVASAILVVAVLASAVAMVYIYHPFDTKKHLPRTNLTESTWNFEREFLIEFFNATNGYEWKKNDSWLTSESICTWYGIVCNAENRISLLSLQRNNLYGTIPATINKLSQLQYLDLSLNLLFGVIPKSIGDIKSLKTINLASNKLASPIPTSIAQLYNLEEFNLAANQVLGSIPPQLGQLSKLKMLNLAYNQLSNTIPVSIGSLTALQSLSLDSNRLLGEIPDSIGQLGNLTNLILSNNGFNSVIPPVLFQMPSLQSIAIENSQISGFLPDFNLMPNLITLSLGGNQLSGTIPPSISNLPILQLLGLGNNLIYGTIPSLMSLNNIREIYLQSNQLSGQFPEFSATNLIAIDISCNQLAGTIPSFLSSANELMWLSMQNNSFGTLDMPTQPKSIAKCNMAGNPFVCPVPQWAQQKCLAACHL